MSDDTLYDRDFYAWTAEQAERVRQLPTDCGVDIANVVEELETLGRWHRREVEDNLRRALAYALCWAFDDNPDAAMRDDVSEPGWTWFYEYELRTGEALTFAEEFFDPSMAADIDLSRVWQGAIRKANSLRSAQRKPTFGTDLPCPFALDELLAGEWVGWDLRDRIAAHLGGAAASQG